MGFGIVPPYTLVYLAVPANCFHCKRQAGSGFRGAGTENNVRAGVGTNGKPVFPMDVMFE